jgi:anti-sigma B factor antagonist
VSRRHQSRVIAAARRDVEPMWIDGDCACVRAPVEVDILNTAQLRTEVTAASQASPSGHVLLLMDAVEFIDSTGFGVMTGAHKRATERGGLFVLVTVPDRVRSRLDTFGLTGHLTLADTLDDAHKLCGRTR